MHMYVYTMVYLSLSLSLFASAAVAVRRPREALSHHVSSRLAGGRSSPIMCYVRSPLVRLSLRYMTLLLFILLLIIIIITIIINPVTLSILLSITITLTMINSIIFLLRSSGSSFPESRLSLEGGEGTVD